MRRIAGKMAAVVVIVLAPAASEDGWMSQQEKQGGQHVHGCDSEPLRRHFFSHLF